jgi:hypothetical protein
MRKLHILFGVAAVSLLGLAGCQSGAEVVPGDYSVFRIASVDAGKQTGDCGTVDPNPTSTHKTTFRAGSTFLAYGISTTTGDDLYLDIGGEVLPGELQADGSYQFRGVTTDTQVTGGKTIFDSDHDGIDDNVDTMVDADGDGIDDKQQDPMVDVDGDGIDDRGADNLVDLDGDGLDDREVVLPGDTTITSVSTLTITFTPADKAIAGTGVTNVKTSCDGKCTAFDEASLGINCTTSTAFVGIQIGDASVSVPIGDAPTNGQP